MKGSMKEHVPGTYRKSGSVKHVRKTRILLYITKYMAKPPAVQRKAVTEPDSPHPSLSGGSQDDNEELEEDGHAHDVEDGQDVSDDLGGAPVVTPKKRKKTNTVRTHY